METKADSFFGRYGLRINAPFKPSFAGICEFQLITILNRFIRGECGPDFRHFQVPESNQLIFNLLAFSFKLKMIG